MAVLVDPPHSDEIDGLRRALGDPSLGRIPPHVTLVPPVNVRAAELTAALEVLRAAAAAVPGPLTLTLGAVTTFMPVNPVLYLQVGGDLDGLRRLRDAVFRPPLERSLSWPWVPHATLADGAEPDRIEAARAALGSYAVAVEIDRVVLLEEGRGRVWSPLADARLGPPVRIGTGGLTLHLTAGRLPDPELAQARAALTEGAEGRCGPEGEAGGPPPALLAPVVVTAHRDGTAVGQAVAAVGPAGPEVEVWVRPDARRQGVGGHLLAHLEHELHRAGWAFPELAARGPAGFYAARSRWSVPAGA